MRDEELAKIIRLTDVYIHSVKLLSFFERLKYKHPIVITITGQDGDTHISKKKYYVDVVSFEDTTKIVIEKQMDIHIYYHKFKENVFATNIIARITIYPNNEYSVALIQRLENK